MRVDKSLVLGLALLLAAATARPLVAQQINGKAVYEEECKSCHGLNGVPPERERARYKNLRALGDSGFVSALPRDLIVTIVTKGIDKDMKSFAGKLSEAEIRAVAGYIKDLATKRAGGT
jgi:mono/diheme cytochrome c family protein